MCAVPSDRHTKMCAVPTGTPKCVLFLPTGTPKCVLSLPTGTPKCVLFRPAHQNVCCSLPTGTPKAAKQALRFAHCSHYHILPHNDQLFCAISIILTFQYFSKHNIKAP
jgi:hypothetical protein